MTVKNTVSKQPYPYSLLRSTRSSDTDTATGYEYNSPQFNFLEQFQSNKGSTTNNNSNNNNNQNNNNGMEIWLDLRGTSLSPSTALELWQLEHPIDTTTDHNDDQDYDAPFTKCLVSQAAAAENGNAHQDNVHLMQQQQQQQPNDDIQIVLIDNNTMNDNHDQQTIQSSSWGTILPLQTSPQSNIPILPDPLPAMETISQGKYILLDTTGDWKKVEEKERLGYLLPLAELISSGADNNSSSSGSGGLIGFTCHTRNEVVRVAMWIQSVTNRQSGSGDDGGQKNVRRVKTLENGLVIPDYDDDEEVEDGSGEELQLQFGSVRQGGLRYAIVVPYDVALLKTARDFC